MTPAWTDSTSSLFFIKWRKSVKAFWTEKVPGQDISTFDLWEHLKPTAAWCGGLTCNPSDASQAGSGGWGGEARRAEVSDWTLLRDTRGEASRSPFIQKWQSICQRRAAPQGDRCLLRWPNQKLSAWPLAFLYGEAQEAAATSAARRNLQRRCRVDRLIRQPRHGAESPLPKEWFNLLWDELLQSCTSSGPTFRSSTCKCERTYAPHTWSRYGCVTRMNGRLAKDGRTA